MRGQTSADAGLSCFDGVWWDKGYKCIAGIDEVGRGCLAGPVVACAVVLRPYEVIPGVRDSKVLSPARRRVLSEVIQERALAFAVAEVSADEIDRINIRRASLKAMRLAVEKLSIKPDLLLVDGNVPLDHPVSQEIVVSGDARSLSIAAASIMAKVYRDLLMESFHDRFPQYMFARHKGYPTSDHRKAINVHGCSPLHRKTFRGVLDGA